MKFMMKQSELMKMALDKSLAKRGSDDPVTKGLQQQYDSLLKAEHRKATGKTRENPLDNFSGGSRSAAPDPMQPAADGIEEALDRWFPEK